jgi:hypothetical protein
MRTPSCEYVGTIQANKTLLEKGGQILIEPLQIRNKTTDADQVDDSDNVSNMFGGAFQATGLGSLECRYSKELDSDVGENRERNRNSMNTRKVNTWTRTSIRIGY